MAVCGPKLSLCCAVLSVWGIIQLGLMGVFFYIHSLAFADDLPAEFDEKKDTIETFYDKVDTAYTQVAYNVWIAAGLYVIVLAISVQQFRANMRNK
ncbi:Ribonuclease kappa-like Protein [Tribolium castaneum]|uniref:Ribonuclease kappa-like Protein n=1 Tax=Tribolium castaneum TaxID=7070 RepID=D6WZ17_TRICA|nr:PREDICTED: ribonuclease kappa-B [Tribolium castaneum]EFA09039.1 Ribonuclease kappa-like Protein [Tribolium castaneum]|eukprot:XP_008197386.1 PREDICTED: ribonuclease kappa-B [Tribolium castaneum]